MSSWSSTQTTNHKRASLTAPAKEWDYTPPRLVFDQSGGRQCHPVGRALKLAARSRCPTARWLDALAPWLGRHSPVVFLNVGANKGYAVASILQRFTSVNLTNAGWLAALQHYQENKTLWARANRQKKLNRVEKLLHTPCGACQACQETPARLRDNLLSADELDIHVFEMLDANVEWLRWAFDHFGVTGFVNQGVVSNETGRVNAPVRMPLGSEFVTALPKAARVSSRHQWLVGELPKLR